MKSLSETSEPRRRDHNVLVQGILVQELCMDNDRLRVQKGLKQLADLCLMGQPSSCEAHRQTVYRSQGYHAMVGALQRYIFCPVTAAEGCRCMQNSTMDVVDYQETAVAAGALEIVARVLRRHGSDRYVQRVGCGALYALTKNHARHAKQLVCHIGVRSTIVTALRAFGDSQRLQMWGCLALENLSQWPDLTGPLVESGSLVALAAAMETYKTIDSMEVAVIQESARLAMKRLSYVIKLGRIHCTTCLVELTILSIFCLLFLKMCTLAYAAPCASQDSGRLAAHCHYSTPNRGSVVESGLQRAQNRGTARLALKVSDVGMWSTALCRTRRLMGRSKVVDELRFIRLSVDDAGTSEQMYGKFPFLARLSVCNVNVGMKQ
jgi:hypothetical protein